MKQHLRWILLTFVVCSLAAAVGAEENDSAVKQAPMASPIAAAPEATPSPEQKQTEVDSAQKSTRLGHVDLAKIAAESETGKAGQARLLDLKKKLQGQIETKRKQLEKQQAAIQAKIKTLTSAQRDAKSKEFQKKVEEFQKFGLNAEKELQVKQEEFSTKLFKAIELASAEMGKAKDLAIVVIKRELLYLGSGVDALDVTDDVIKRVDEQETKK